MNGIFISNQYKVRGVNDYWKRVSCLMKIRPGHQNAEIMTVAECSLNTVTTFTREMKSCSEDYETVDCS